ncbi:hypothetical protein SAMN05421863_100773 [Nitrosomonas communis]|uniref:Uncharacterized protein n=1 Tax=Nitrosomonas communis TaxID=44574 RepID=A0A1I4LSK3_9PROT|nr:hypothetical protein SAMN05421863_100773 [Nitrosomonas communis]
MKLYLTPELQAHRRGRFLASLLGISQSPEHGLPQTGFVLMTGEQLQASRESQEECAAWVRQPGCSLLLLPPYQEGSIFHFLDWVVELAPSIAVAVKRALLMSMLEGELTYRLRGVNGACTEDMPLGEPTCHTRYWKGHSNSGLIAATTLPLWSISLLDQAALVHDFLAKIERHCGLPSVTTEETKPQEDAIRPEDVTVLVCSYGFNVATAEGLLSRLKTYAVPLLNLANFDLPESMVRLRNAGLINDNGLTEQGLAHLMGCKYWAFAENLRNEA